MEKVSPTYKVIAKCYHCGNDCNQSVLYREEKTFCCAGCKAVYELLDENNLCNYYTMQSMPGTRPEDLQHLKKYEVLDDESIKKHFVKFTNSEEEHVVFYLPSMHCSSCIYLLENLQRLHPAVAKSSVNFQRKEITVVYNPTKLYLKELASILHSLGYAPYISLNDAEQSKSGKTDRAHLYKIGVAGFCFGNIMMLSFPEYFSLGNFYEQHTLKYTFTYLSLILSLPVLLYSSQEFFISALAAIRNRYLNIDAPIALAILITFVRSVYEIAIDHGNGYLDSMSGIVFFMLVGRYFQNKTYDSISFERDYKSYFPIGVSVIKDEQEESIPVNKVSIGDRIIVRNNELIPTDAILFKGTGNIDYSFVTGESTPVQKVVGEIIYAGGKQIGEAIELEVVKDVSSSYLTQLWNNTNETEVKTVGNKYVDIINKYFSIGLLVIAAATFIYWYFIDIATAIDAVTTILIVACPCALLLSATFTYGNMLRILGKNKFYLKNAAVIDKISDIDTIVFDKTGTITYSDSEIHFQGRELSKHLTILINTVARQSSHPLSRQLSKWYKDLPILSLHSFSEYIGKGVEVYVNDYKVKLGSYSFVTGKDINELEKSTTVHISINNQYWGFYIFENSYRVELKNVVNSLQKKYELHVLSGDNANEKSRLATLFNFKANLIFNQKPENKLNYIKNLKANHHKVIMMGDGLNDAGALLQSNVGIAVSDNINNFTPASDAILAADNFGKIDQLLNYCTYGRKIVGGSFIISLLYNVVGLSFALTGQLKPVIAAILMPISTISIVLFTTIVSYSVAKWKFKLIVKEQ